MAWVKGTEQRTFLVRRPLDVVRDYFLNPAEFRAAFTQLESSEEIAPNQWRWTLVSKTELGVTFKGVYTVTYTPDITGGKATWATFEGNMRSSGSVHCLRESDTQTEVHYVETLEIDLPIPSLAARLFHPIVAREIRSKFGEFLDESVKVLEG